MLYNKKKKLGAICRRKGREMKYFYIKNYLKLYTKNGGI